VFAKVKIDMNKPEKLIKKLEAEFLKVADPIKAEAQKKYMKSQMQFFGVSLPDVKKISNAVFKDFIPEDNQEYCNTLLYLFEHAKQREIWYAGITYASKFKKFILEENIDVYIKIIRISGWWDIVDMFAANLVGTSLLGSKNMYKFANKWICDKNMWVRRTALLFQLRYKDKTDFDLLSGLILKVSHEKEFFIRKAIGWSLREYSKTNPEIVKTFIESNKDKLSGLSILEGLKVIKRNQMTN